MKIFTRLFFGVILASLLLLGLTDCGTTPDNDKPDLSIPDAVNPLYFNNGFTSGVLTLDTRYFEVLKGAYLVNGVYTCNTYINVQLMFTGNIFLKNEFYSVTRAQFEPLLGRVAQVTYVWNTQNFPYQICLGELNKGEVITMYKVITNSTNSNGSYGGNSGSLTATKLIRVKDGKIEEQTKSEPTVVVPPQQFRVIKNTFAYEGPGDFIHKVTIDENNKIDEENEGNNNKSDSSKGLVVK